MPADNAVITVKYEITTSNPDKENPCHLNKVLGGNKLSFLSTADIHSLCFFGSNPAMCKHSAPETDKICSILPNPTNFLPNAMYTVYIKLMRSSQLLLHRIE